MVLLLADVWHQLTAKEAEAGLVAAAVPNRLLLVRWAVKMAVVCQSVDS